MTENKASENALPPLSFYLHFPWCVRKCPYCDFNSYAVRSAHPEPRFREYLEALRSDISSQVPLAAGRPLASIYLGGGTPSLLPSAFVGEILGLLSESFALSKDCEISMEANPGTVAKDYFPALKASGVNRVSLGVQSFQNENLARIGRIHDAFAAFEAVESASAAFSNFNIDLMFALPGQDMLNLGRDLKAALSCGAPHLSYYELTLEKGTLFGKKPPSGLPDADQAFFMQEEVEKTLSGNGYERYEVSGYAKDGAYCRHNLNYWSFGDYLAAGAGAHGKISRISRSGCLEVSRCVHHSSPGRYLADPAPIFRRVPQKDLPFEFMLNALRLTDGVPSEFFTERTGISLGNLAALMEKAQKTGLLQNSPDRIAATPKGRLFLSDLQELFL